MTVLCCRPSKGVSRICNIDLLSQGRAEMVVGRGSFVEAFPLFGLHLEDYDSLFAEKLELLLKICDNVHVFWSGKYRPSLNGQGIYPRPLQNPFPIWIGVGGTSESRISYDTSSKGSRNYYDESGKWANRWKSPQLQKTKF